MNTSLQGNTAASSDHLGNSRLKDVKLRLTHIVAGVCLGWRAYEILSYYMVNNPLLVTSNISLGFNENSLITISTLSG